MPSPLAMQLGVLPAARPGGRKVATRDRLIRAAVTLFQRRGFHAVGIAEILAAAACPRGSLYHHFPDGKAGLAVAAIAWLTDEVVSALHRTRLAGHRSADLIGTFAAATAGWLEETQWSEGSLFSVLTQETVPHDVRISAALAAAYGRIVAELADWLTADGMSPAKAAEAATILIANLEGALMLARATRDKRPLELIPAALAPLLIPSPGPSGKSARKP